jgi:ribosome-associated protein
VSSADGGPDAEEASASDVAVAAARAAEDKLATDVVVLDVASVLGICDHFVLATAQNERQVKAVVDAVEEVLRRDLGRRPRAEEGKGARRWVLLDYGDVVVHVFHVEERSYYRLERLYGDVPRIPWRAEEVAGSEPSDEAG